MSIMLILGAEGTPLSEFRVLGGGQWTQNAQWIFSLHLAWQWPSLHGNQDPECPWLHCYILAAAYCMAWVSRPMSWHASDLSVGPVLWVLRFHCSVTCRPAPVWANLHTPCCPEAQHAFPSKPSGMSSPQVCLTYLVSFSPRGHMVPLYPIITFVLLSASNSSLYSLCPIQYVDKTNTKLDWNSLRKAVADCHE